MYTRVRELRQQKRVSQITLATRIGCSQNTISKIEKGECDPKGSILIEMSKYFGVSIDYLLGICDVKNYTEAYVRYGRIQNIGIEYSDKINRLSAESKEAVRSVVDRMTELEKKK